MKDHSRRSFVKTSAATGLTFTFAGLIRAHGQSGGGTTWPGSYYTTTWDSLATATSSPEYTTTCNPNVIVTTQAVSENQTTESTTPASVWNARFVMHYNLQTERTFFNIGEFKSGQH